MITGPELDLLQEVLSEDPAADIFLDVAHALLDRGDTRKAAMVLRRAFESGAANDDAARTLAQAASEVGDDKGLRLAAEHLGEDAMRREPALARAWAVALDRGGSLEKAAELAQALLDAHGDDDELRAIIDRQKAPPPEGSVRGRDPFFTAARAEEYLESSRIDLAVRVYRRILAANPDDNIVHARLLRLRAMPWEARPWVEDLSEEYWVQHPVPPLAMPAPRLVPDTPAALFHTGDPAEDATAPSEMRQVGQRGATLPIAGIDSDDEVTTLMREALGPGLADGIDEEETVLLADGAPRHMPGIDDLRAALAEDEESSADPPSHDDFVDDIIEQARAIERAADRRRRSLFRK
ncbi:MAG: hypothetical protein AB8H79_14065 [Myxococcota bacterium]